MTMPTERLRSLIWGAELIPRLIRDQSVAADLRTEATRLLASYPSAEELRRLVAANAHAMSGEHAAAIEAALRLFEQVHFRGGGDVETRRLTLFTLRHFPTRGLAASWSDAFFPTLGDWLASDDGAAARMAAGPGRGRQDRGDLCQ